MARDGPPSPAARKGALERGREAYQSQRYKNGVVFFSQVRLDFALGALFFDTDR